MEQNQKQNLETQTNTQVPAVNAPSGPETAPVAPPTIDQKAAEPKEKLPKSPAELFAEIPEELEEYERKHEPPATLERQKPTVPTHSQQSVEFIRSTKKTVQELDDVVSRQLHTPEADEGGVLHQGIETLNKLSRAA